MQEEKEKDYVAILIDIIYTEYSYHLVNIKNSFVKETKAFRNYFLTVHHRKRKPGFFLMWQLTTHLYIAVLTLSSRIFYPMH